MLGAEAHADEPPRNAAQPREALDDLGQHQRCTVSVLDVSGVDHGVDQIALGVGQNVALATLDLFARIIAMRIDTEPPFSALLTLWLSMMAAVGLASRSPCSRHST